MPPSTEELSSNPIGYSGFNTHLIPATSNSYEIGTRGFYGNFLNFEVTGFIMNTDNDFFRFKQSGRGNQEVFYGNAGNSEGYGIETILMFIFWMTSVCRLHIRMLIIAIFQRMSTWSNTLPIMYSLHRQSGQWLPNSPRHQLYIEVLWSVTKNWNLQPVLSTNRNGVFTPMQGSTINKWIRSFTKTAEWIQSISYPGFRTFGTYGGSMVR